MITFTKWTQIINITDKVFILENKIQYAGLIGSSGSHWVPDMLC